MDRLRMTLSFLILATTAFSQSNFVHVYGRTFATVAYRNDDTVTVENATVKLVCKDTVYLQITPADGTFSFKIPTSSKTATLFVETGKSTRTKEKYQCVFISPRTFHLIDLKEPREVSYNFELRPNELPHCISRFATFFFEKQSALPRLAISNDTISVDSAVLNISKLLLDFPKMRVEVIGHTDRNEIEKNSLSAARAKNIADKLMLNGVRTDQVTVLAYADKSPFPFIEKIYASTDFAYTTDKKILSHRNQRVSFKIVDWGWD